MKVSRLQHCNFCKCPLPKKGKSRGEEEGGDKMGREARIKQYGTYEVRSSLNHNP
jgi:hypothetical protein